MIAHLSIPAIDNTANRPTSLSRANVTELLRDEMNYKGLTFTDGLEMKGVTKFFPAGEAAVEAIIAGNDMLCLPEDVPAAIEAIKVAVDKKRIKQKEIDSKVRKVLAAKFDLGLQRAQYVDTANLLNDLNAKTDDIKKAVAKSTISVLRNEASFFPLKPGQKIAYVGLGRTAVNTFGNRLVQDLRADTFSFSYKDDTAKAGAIVRSIEAGLYDAVIIGVHEYSFRPANNYGLGTAAMQLWSSLQAFPTATFMFGNVYAAQNFCTAKTLVAVHQDDVPFQQSAADFLHGAVTATGKLPVSICTIPYGSGIAVSNRMPVGVSAPWLAIDSIVTNGIAQGAFPGAVVLAAQGGRIKYHKAFGNYEFDPRSMPVTLESIFDLASVTKISATTVAIMKLYEQGKVSLDATLGDYLPWTRGTNKAGLTVKDILLHQAGLNPFIPFYKETLDASGTPSAHLYKTKMDTLFNIPVARNLYLRKDWNDTLFQRILASPLTEKGKYVYSDNDFIFLAKIVEAVSGMNIDEYTRKTFYLPLGMSTTGFNPWKSIGSERIVPTEEEKQFRKQLLRGYVHDEGASLFGGVAGHAGLFSNAYDLSLLYQMLLNGGELHGERYLKKETIDLFTAYQSGTSRRGFGFDKPEKDSVGTKNRYPSLQASPQTFGHTGFTGTAVWVDPETDLVYIFLSNRVHPTREN
ncbi:MAG TPA: serine hydrolase, partial [Flavisolibacter sp.]